jgi:hypothetical protein
MYFSDQIQFFKSKIPNRYNILKIYLTLIFIGSSIGFVIFINEHYNSKFIASNDISTNRKVLEIKQNFCSKDSDCLNGICIYSIPTVCQCNQGFTSFGGTCNYQQKSGLVAFLLSFFIGTLGADWFYLYVKNSSNGGAYVVAGFFKLITLGMFGIWVICFKFQ